MAQSAWPLFWTTGHNPNAGDHTDILVHNHCPTRILVRIGGAKAFAAESEYGSALGPQLVPERVRNMSVSHILITVNQDGDRI